MAANIPYILQLTFVMQVIYVTLLAAVKVSVLCFYIRVFVGPFMQRSSKATLGFVAAWWLAYICSCVFLCTPISGQWTGVGKCGAYIPMIQSLIATNAIGDAIIMILPLYSVWSLKMRNTEKMAVSACFLIGIA